MKLWMFEIFLTIMFIINSLSLSCLLREKENTSWFFHVKFLKVLLFLFLHSVLTSLSGNGCSGRAVTRNPETERQIRPRESDGGCPRELSPNGPKLPFSSLFWANLFKFERYNQRYFQQVRNSWRLSWSNKNTCRRWDTLVIIQVMRDRGQSAIEN